MSILSKPKVLFNSLYKFYSSKDNLNTFIFLRNTQKSGVSLRIFDKYTTQYVLSNTKIFPGTYISVYDSYREQLKSWTKGMFDPNARDHSDPTKYSDEDNILLKSFSLLIPKIGNIEDTNIGQLNFFRWAIQDNIYSLIINDLDNIKMFIKTKNKKTTRKPKDSPKDNGKDSRGKKTNTKPKTKTNKRSSSPKNKKQIAV